MLSRVSRAIAEHELLAGPNGRRLLVAVSGGPDSMALLGCLWELAPRLDLVLEVAFVDHGLRPEAVAEGELVAARARDLDLPFHRLEVDVRGARAGRGAKGGVQEVARRLRLSALEGRAGALRLGGVALGHQADDQTETVLFRVLRGTGLAGLAGIPYRRTPFIRPLLDVTRVEIIDYLRRRSLPFVSDPSNSDLRYARARLRHRVLPLLREENPRVDEALRRLGAAAAGRTFLAPRGSAPEGAAGAGDVVASEASVVRRPGAVPGRIAERIAVAARMGHGTRTFDLPGSRKVVITYGEVQILEHSPDQNPGACVRRRDAASGLDVATAHPVGVPAPGVFRLGAGGGALWVREHRGDTAPEGDLAWFDGDQLAWPLAVRGRRAGDRMRPRRGVGARKLADLMIDAKIPRNARGRVPVVVGSDGNVLFVPGLRPAAVAQPTAATRRWIGLGMLQPIEDVG